MMRVVSVLISVFLLVFVFAEAAARGQLGGVGSAAPAAIRAVLESDTVGRGKTVRLGIEVKVGAGFHVQSAKPHDKYLIPTTVKVTGGPGVSAGEVRFPVAVEVPAPKGASSSPTLSVYE